MKIAILGANGFLGLHLCEMLIKKKYNVIAFYHQPKWMYSLNKFKIPKIKVDITDKKSLQNAFQSKKELKKIDVLIHCASLVSIGDESKELVEDINVQGTQNVINICFDFKIKKLIYVSSIHAIDHDEFTPIVDESLPSAIQHNLIYNRTKSKAQELVKDAAKKGLFTVILNPTGFLGPGDIKPSFMGKFIVNIYKNKIPSLLHAGFDWIDVRDVAQGIIAAMTKGKKGEQYLLSGHWASLKNLSEIIEKVTSKKTTKFCLPFILAIIGLPFLKIYSKLLGTPPLYTYDSLMMLKEANKNITHKKASKALGFTPRPLETTIRDTCNWFQQNGYFGV